MSSIDPDAPAYNGDIEPQRGELSPRQRDILCRLIRNELWHLRERERTVAAGEPDPYLPTFMQGGTPYTVAGDAEVPLMLDARAKLSPRTDDAQAVQAFIEHDAAAGLEEGPR